MGLFSKLGDKLKQYRKKNRQQVEEGQLERIKIKCPFCKSSIPANALRCSQCTADLMGKDAQGKIEGQLKQRHQNILIGTIGFGFIFILIVVIIIILASNPSQQTTTQMRQAVQPQKAAKTEKVVAPPSAQFPNKQYDLIFFYADGRNTQFQAKTNYTDITVLINTDVQSLGDAKKSICGDKDRFDFLYNQESGLLITCKVLTEGTNILFEGIEK